MEESKVIEFPKNKNIENQLRYDKLQVAIEWLKYLHGKEVDFSILLDKHSAMELFDAKTEKIKDFIIISADIQKVKSYNLNFNYNLYEIKGTELD